MNVSIKDIVAQAVKLRASKIIFVHNSSIRNILCLVKADIDFTDKLFNAVKMFNIDLLDHIIVSKKEYTSVFSYLKEKIAKIENTTKNSK